MSVTAPWVRCSRALGSGRCNTHRSAAVARPLARPLPPDRALRTPRPASLGYSLLGEKSNPTRKPSSRLDRSSRVMCIYQRHRRSGLPPHDTHPYDQDACTRRSHTVSRGVWVTAHLYMCARWLQGLVAGSRLALMELTQLRGVQCGCELDARDTHCNRRRGVTRGDTCHSVVRCLASLGLWSLQPPPLRCGLPAAGWAALSGPVHCARPAQPPLGYSPLAEKSNPTRKPSATIPAGSRSRAVGSEP